MFFNIDFTGAAKATERARIIKSNEKFHKEEYRPGYEEGFKAGLRAHCIATSELSDKENELLIKFLELHNFVLCYDGLINGFRLRRNDKIEYRKPTVLLRAKNPFKVPLKSDGYQSRLMETVEESLLDNALREIDHQHMEKQSRLNRLRD